MGNAFHSRIINNFTLIPNEFVNDNRLKPGAKGVFLYLASKGMAKDDEEFNFSATRISQDFDCGAESIQRSIKQLIESGWLTREKMGADDPARNVKRGQILYELQETPTHTNPIDNACRKTQRKREEQKEPEEPKREIPVKADQNGNFPLWVFPADNKQRRSPLPPPSEKEEKTTNTPAPALTAPVRETSPAAAFLALLKWATEIGAPLSKFEEVQWRNSLAEFAKAEGGPSQELQAEAIEWAQEKGFKFPFAPKVWRNEYRRWRNARDEEKRKRQNLL